MSKKQTAIEWLIETLESDIKVDKSNMVTIKIHEHDYIKSKQVAKEMEKEQLLDMGNQFAIMGEDSPEQYYNKTYN
jgi:hypothetical protein